MNIGSGYYMRSYWQRLKRASEGCRPKLALQLCMFEEGYSLHLLGFFIPLTLLDKWRRKPHEIMESWGVIYCDKALHLNWGRHCKVFWAPWMFERVSNDVQRSDGSWAPFVGSWEQDKKPDGRHVEEFPYHYMLDSGEVQHVMAKVHIERSEYRWRCAKWLPFPRRRYRTLEVEFSGEVGERAGSWKGGCIGCGYKMKPGETSRETLLRMQRERRFR